MKKQKKGLIFILMLALCSSFLASINLNTRDKTFNDAYQPLEIMVAAVENYELVFNREWGGSNIDSGNGIALDSLGNIYITGSTNTSGTNDYDAFIAKYDSSGNSLMNITWSTSDWDEGYDIALDDSGNIYITGQIGDISNGDAFVAKFDSLGNSLNNFTWDIGNDEGGNDIALDSSGNIYITGRNWNFMVNHDAFIAKFDSSLNSVMNITWDGNENDEGKGIVLDGSGNIYIAGSTGTFSEDNDAFIAKYNSSGTFIKSFIWGSSGYDYGMNIALDNSGYLYMTGKVDSSGGGTEDAFIAKFDSSVNSVMNITWDGGYEEYGEDIVLDGSGNIYITGETQSSVDAFLAKFDSSGNSVMNLTWGVPDDGCGEGIALDSSGNIYIVGTVWHNQGMDAYIRKYKFPPFELNTNTTGIDLDGTFLLNWSESFEANNYSVYQHDEYIHEIRNNGTLIEEGITKLNRTMTVYTTGDYYFIIYAFNERGNISSNCIYIQVYIPPGPFSLTSPDAGSPDYDGEFDLIWGISAGADNYTVYWDTTSFTTYTGDQTILIDEQNVNTAHFSTLNNGTYYFRVCARNMTGETYSDDACLQIVVSIPLPGFFSLTSPDAGFPDDDGKFTLTWSLSSNAENYTLYQSLNMDFITDTGSQTILVNEQLLTSISVTVTQNGTYYFRVCARNRMGERYSDSSTFQIFVQIPASANNDSDDDKTPEREILGYDLFLLIGLIGILSVLVAKKRLSSK